MGGSALLIHGIPAAALLTPRPAARTVTDRLLGRHPLAGPRETRLGADRVLLEIPSGPLQPIADDFRAFVGGAFAEPWAATANVRDYLAMDVITSYLRGERIGEEPPGWYFQLTFSACAGMADTAAELAAHWAEIWYRGSAGDLLSRYFRPFGFAPGWIEPAAPDARFVPLGWMGYALFRAEPELDPDERGSRYFELDYSAVETLGDADRSAAWRELDASLADVRAAGACLCQFCAPSLDVSRFERLSIVAGGGA
jgi:hypothetical protein